MNHDELMRLAIGVMAQCRAAPGDPMVGAVIAIDGEVIATAYRGETEDRCGDIEHAEKTALSKVSSHNLSRATVYTTLEPCTRHVRRKPGESCTDRLVRMQVGKVVIGMLDPNQGVCGRGVLKLQEAGIEVALFPHELAMEIRRQNDSFIQAQLNPGISITYPADGAEFCGTDLEVGGTFKNTFGDNFIAVTTIENRRWWPQLDTIKVVTNEDNRWLVNVNFGMCCPHTISIVKASPLGMVLVDYYREMISERSQAITNVAARYGASAEEVRRIIAPTYWGFTMDKFPHGFDKQASITVNVRSLKSSPST